MKVNKPFHVLTLAKIMHKKTAFGAACIHTACLALDSAQLPSCSGCSLYLEERVLTLGYLFVLFSSPPFFPVVNYV